jgi:hypothetical protein
MVCPQLLHEVLDGVGLLVQGGEGSVSLAQDLAFILAIARRFWEYALRGSSRLEKVTVLEGVKPASDRVAGGFDLRVENCSILWLLVVIGELITGGNVVEETLVSDVPLTRDREEAMDMVSSVVVELVCTNEILETLPNEISDMLVNNFFVYVTTGVCKEKCFATTTKRHIPPVAQPGTYM